MFPLMDGKFESQNLLRLKYREGIKCLCWYALLACDDGGDEVIACKRQTSMVGFACFCFDGLFGLQLMMDDGRLC
jgi:hypothetical protein